MKTPFQNRAQAGRLLGDVLQKYANHHDVVVVGLPRGGVAVAAQVAAQLNAPLDVLVVRKLGVPGHLEYAMGAMASGGIRILNQDLIKRLGISPATIQEITEHEAHELKRREAAYRSGKSRHRLEGKTVILVDDGVATGYTVLAAVHAAKRMHPARLVLAVPVLCSAAHRNLCREVDEVVALVTPDDFFAVGEWYEDFSQMTDDEVRMLLEEAACRPAPAEPEEWSPHHHERSS